MEQRHMQAGGSRPAGREEAAARWQRERMQQQDWQLDWQLGRSIGAAT
jgi:hypothetical protein